MYKSKEAIVIEETEDKLLKFKNRYSEDDPLLNEYSKLLKYYKKLNKQFSRMIKSSDSSSKYSLEKIEKTVSLAREKIIDTLSSKNKIQEQMIKDKNKIKELENQLKVLKAK